MRMLLPVLMLGFAATTAHAADNGFYVGAGISKSQIDDVFGTDTDIDIDDESYKIIAGFRPIDLVAAEINYTDLGSESVDFGLGSARAEAKAFSGFVLGFLPIPLPFLDVYGKVGLARWEVEGRTSGVALTQFDEKGTEFAWGGGVQVSLGSLAARLEYDNFDIENTDGLEAYTLGVTWTFL